MNAEARKVEEIRQEHARETLLGDNTHYDEISALLAYIDALAQAGRERDAAARAEVERLKREVAEGFKVEVMDVTGDPAMMAENGRLKADLARLQAALEDTWHAPHCPIFSDVTVTNDCQCGRFVLYKWVSDER